MNKPEVTSEITITIEPLEKGIRSLLADVIDQFDSLQRYLRTLVESETTFEIKSLSTNSPLKAVLIPLTPEDTIAGSIAKSKRAYRESSEVSKRVSESLNQLADSSGDSTNIDLYPLVQLQDLATELERSGHRAVLTINGSEYTVDEKLRRLIDSKLASKHSSYCSYTGTLERLNVHGKRWSFTIFPIAGPKSILCKFDRDLLEEVRSYVKEVVTVKGRAYFADLSPWPFELHLESIKLRPPAKGGTWLSMPERLAADWKNSSDSERELSLQLEAEGG